VIFILSKEENRKKWSEIIKDQSFSGLTQVEWCKNNDVNIHNFRYWRKRLQEAPLDDRKISFVSIKPTPATFKRSITLRIGAATLDITGDVNPDVLDTVVQVLMRYA
jgi:transposase-like protein